MHPNIYKSLDRSALATVPTSLPSPAVARKARFYLLLALMVLAAVFSFGARSWVQFFHNTGGPVGLFTQTDFPGVVIGARLVSSGQGAQLYNLDAQLKEQQSIRAQGYFSLSDEEDKSLKYTYPYPPYLAALWSPMSGISPLTQMALYDILSIIAMVVGLSVLLWSLPIPSASRFVVLLAALTCFPFIVNLEQGQSSGIMLLPFAVGISLLRHRRNLPAGLVLGLLVLKVQWLPLFILVLLWKRQWSALIGMAATAISLTLLVVAVMGTSWIPDYVRILEMGQRFAPELILDPHTSHSLTGVLSIIASMDVLRTAILVATLLVGGLLLLAWRGEWRPGDHRWDGAMALTMLAVLFTNLQLNTHDLCLVALPAALGISYFSRSLQERKRGLTWYALLWITYLAFVPPFLFTQPVRFSTLMIALLLVFLAVPLLQQRSTPRAIATTT